MPSKKHQQRTAADAVQRTLPTIPSDWLDQLVTGPMTAAAVEDTVQAFRKALIERAMGAELSHHLGAMRLGPTNPKVPATSATARAARRC